MKTARILIGLIVWAVLIGATVWAGNRCTVADGNAFNRLVPHVWQYARGGQQTRKIHLEQPAELALGDPVFFVDEASQIRQIGEVSELEVGDAGTLPTGHRGAIVRQAAVLLYPSAPPLRQDSSLTYHHTPDSMEWVLQTMLPPEKRHEIAVEVRDAMIAHRQEVIDAMRPVVQQSLLDAFAVVEEDLPKALQRHRVELERLGVRYQDEIVRQEIIPLVKKEVWPIVRRRAQPMAEEIGEQLWDRASLWRFGWRYVYDRSFGPEQSLVKQEWSRFLQEEAAPVLQEHTDDFVWIQQRVLSDLASNRAIQQATRRNLSKLASDPQLRQLVWTIIQEVVVDNPRLHDVLQRHWQSPEAQAAFELAADRFEPTAIRISHLLFGDPHSGITPEFARVLRHEVLGKDRRWLVLQPGGGQHAESESLPVRPAETREVNPFVQLTVN